jgi:hypothetical protein
MESNSQSASRSTPSHENSVAQPRKREDRMYQAVTVAAIVLLLGSLWLF